MFTAAKLPYIFTLRKRYTSEPTPPVYPPNHRENPKDAVDKGRRVAHCADLLRQKYELDIQIYGMKNVIEEGVQKRERLRRKSDIMFVEIQSIVHEWKTSTSMKWSEEEWEYVQIIDGILDRHGRSRSRRGQRRRNL